VTQIEAPSYEVQVWRTIIVALGALLLATEVFERPGLWSSYARDVVGPGVIYLLFRGRHRVSEARVLWGLRTPNLVAAFVLGFCVTVEAAQYLGLSGGSFDPYDLAAYAIGLLPWYLADRWRWRAVATNLPDAV
jgi:hypothetical protein